MTRGLRTAAAIVLVGGIMSMTAANGEAATITGGISFSGGWTPTGGTGIADATGVDITSDSALVACAAPIPGPPNCTGSYAPLNGSFIAATYNDFTFAPLGPPAGGPVSLWTFVFGGNTYSFDLSSVTIVSQSSTGLVLRGTGMLAITGFTGTTGSWTFSGDTSGAVIAFSSTTSAVPEGGSTTAFLGLALLALVMFSRKMLV